MAIEYEYDGNLIRFGAGIVEQFSRIAVGSHRTPAAWLAVALESRKHDMLRVQVGTSAPGETAFYSSPVNTNSVFAFDVPATEETALRAFFQSVAQAAGRAT
jgi:hypothetical protein